jgi:hypothetical protein
MYTKRYIALCVFGLMILVLAVGLVDRFTGFRDSQFYGGLTLLFSAFYLFVCISIPRPDIRDRA